jgi:TonB family protein
MSNPEAWKTWEGRVVDGKFPLRQCLGGSEHSAVFLTERPGQASRKAAIKLIAANAADADRQLWRWRAAAQLSDPHLIRIDEAGRCRMDDTPLLYLLMEYAEEDLSQILPQRALTPAEVTDLLPPLLDALSYLHGKGFVHGRIKPSNVLAVGDLLKLSSDRVATPAEWGDGGTRRDVYDAPETAAGIVSPAGDLWSVGATLVEALTQKPPFADEAAQRDPGVPAAIPEPFRGIARECLHLDPKRRCSIAEIKARLQPPARSVPAPPPAPASSARVKHYRATWRILIPIAVLLMFGLGMRLFYKVFPRKPSTEGPVIAYAPLASEPVSSKAATPSAVKPAAASAAVPQPRVRESVAPPREAIASGGEAVRQILPDIPHSAKNTITGTIKIGVRVEVGPSGKVTAAKLTAPGPSKYFAGLTLKAAERWEFTPPQVDGKPTASTWLLRFRLKRTSIQVSPEPVRR